MSRDHRIGGESKHKNRDRFQDAGRPAADEGERGKDSVRRAHTSGKTLKAHGIRQDEAQRQIRELQSRY